MKFKDIKKGDTVYIEKVVKGDIFEQGKSFWIPVKVERVTPTQLIVNGDRYRRDRGQKIDVNQTTRSFIRLLGDDLGCGHKVADETAAMEAFKLKIHMERKIKAIGEKLTSINRSHPNLVKIHSAILGVDKLLKITDTEAKK